MKGTSELVDLQPRRKPLFSFGSQPPPAQIRGSLFQALPEFVKLRFGEQRWPEFLERVDPIAAAALARPMQALDWYPFRVVSAAAETMVAMSSKSGGDATLQALAAHNLDRATNLIFRAIFKVGSPEFMLSKADQVWKKYYSSGRMTVQHATRGSGCVRLHDFPELTRTYNRVILYAVEATIVKAGGRITQREITRDITAGDEYCEYNYTWTM